MRPRPPPAAAFVPLALALAAVGGLSPARADEDLQPTPPRIFFAEPDAATRLEIEALIDTSFADVSKAPVARDVLVRRFGPWSVAPVVQRVRGATNETVVWNAELTLGSLRRSLGPSQLLWPAIRPLLELSRAGSDPYRRAFAALALGTWYGPETVRRGPGSREGTADGATKARESLTDAMSALGAALGDDHPHVQLAAALALGKIGGMASSAILSARLRAAPTFAQVEPRLGTLLAFGLLPGEDDGRIAAALKDPDSRVRAAAALAVTCWAVTQVDGEGADPAPVALRKATELDPLLVATTNPALRETDWGAAEAAFARGMLARITGSMAVWEDLFQLATRPATDRSVSVACAQALLFAPAQSPVRQEMARFLLKPRLGGPAAKDPTVVAAFLLVAGSDGSPEGVHACLEYLRKRDREPLGRAEWDVRFYAAVGLVRAFAAGRIAPAAREEAVEALAEGLSKGLRPGDPGARTFRSVLEEVVGKGARDALRADPEGRLPENAAARLAAGFVDPDALLAADPIDVAVDRLGDAVWVCFGLDGVEKAASGGTSPGAPRQPSKEDQPLRYLMGWLSKEPYFTRLDLHRERGRTKPPPALPPEAARRELLDR